MGHSDDIKALNARNLIKSRLSILRAGGSLSKEEEENLLEKIEFLETYDSKGLETLFVDAFADKKESCVHRVSNSCLAGKLSTWTEIAAQSAAAALGQTSVTTSSMLLKKR